MPFYYLLGVDENTPWPAITGLILSIVLPIGYLTLRRRAGGHAGVAPRPRGRAGGPDFEEFLHYTQMKDGWSRKATLAVLWTWILFVIAAIILVLVMAP